MARWFRKRWAWAALTGATVTLGLAAARAADVPHKPGDVITLNFGDGEKQVKVLKVEKQPDGTVHSEVRDQKTGETFTLVDRPGNFPPAGGAAKGSPPVPDAPKAKPPAGDPSPDKNKDKDKAKEPEKEKRPLLGRVFGDRDKPAASASMKPAEPPEPAKKAGLMSRLFGPKKPSAPAAAPAMPGPSAKPGSGAAGAPPAVVPTPGGFAPPAGTTEPPRAMPATRPVVPPAPVVPGGVPGGVPSIPAPLPAPLPGGSGLPGIPIPPGGTSAARPLQVVVPVGHVPPGVAFDREVRPLVADLQTNPAPSARLAAAAALAGGRHASTDGVKGALFDAAKGDPNGEVRAACVGHLCALGYFDARFLAFVETARTDPDPRVRDAAAAACAKLLRK